MTAQLTIRPAGLTQTPLLVALHAESFGNAGWSADQIRGSLALATSKARVACEGERAVGFILCQTVPQQTEILTLCVCPDRRRRHIGDALLRHVAEEMRAAGGGKILLEVAADNLPARRLYEQFGFTSDGTRANYYKRGAVTVDAVMYGYEVGARG